MSVRLVQLRVVSTAAIAAASSIATGVLAHALGLGDAGLSYLHAVPLACALGIGVFFVAAAVEHRIEQRAVAFAKRLRAREPIVASSFPVSLDPVHHELLELGAELRRHERERADGEALLASIVEGTPAALVLLSSRGTVLATNEASRSLFFDGVNVTGRETVDLLRDTPAVFKRVLAATGDELLVLEDGEGVPHTYHLTKRHFEVAGADVVLVMVSDLSREVARQELDAYKRVIRVLSHEVNNSLAPISSMMHSARRLVQTGTFDPRLERVFDKVAARAEHLRRFLEGYAELARLPLPRKQVVAWAGFFESIGELYPGVGFELLEGGGDSGNGDGDSAGWFDAAQLEQVVVNLVKNAEEAGSARKDISVEVSTLKQGGPRLVIRDRGRGMSPEVMKNAIVPFFSTTPGGSGLGLAICREIVEAHGGTLRLMSRAGGGLEVVIRLPPRSRAKVRSLSGPSVSRSYEHPQTTRG